MAHFLGIIDPVAIRLGGLEIRWYGIIIGLAIFLAVTFANKEALRKGLRADFITDLVFWTLPISLVGARLYYVAFELPYYLEHPEQIIRIWEGGIAIYGGLIAGCATIYWYCKKEKVSFTLLLDIVAPFVLMGQAMGRWGNFTNQEAHGEMVTRNFLENLHLPNFIIEQMNINGVYYQPTFLYESVWSAIGFCLLLYLRRNRAIKVGQIAAIYVAWYSFGRFFIEGLRTDSLMIGEVIRVSQLLSVILFIGAVLFIFLQHKKQEVPRYIEVTNPHF